MLSNGSIIGMPKIKERRMGIRLESHPDLCVGQCVPFYFCPRSVMLYVISRGNHSGLSYRDGQEPIIHLKADFFETIKWAENNNQRWAFTSSNAGSFYFEDFAEVERLRELDWTAINSNHWVNQKEGKQAEFLIEKFFPWELVEEIGVCSRKIYDKVVDILKSSYHRPTVLIKSDWYY